MPVTQRFFDEEYEKMSVKTRDEKLAELARRISAFVPDPAKPLDRLFVPLLKGAVKTGQRGNFGVFAALLDEDDEILAKAPNAVKKPWFKSDGHAECCVLSQYERRMKGDITIYRGKRLLTTLPPCPMCFNRITNAAVPVTEFLGHDPNAIIEQIIAGLPPIWRQIYENQKIIVRQADVSPVLHDFGWLVFEATNDLDQELANR